MDAGRRDAKTQLQEWAHVQGGVQPHYRVVKRSGPDHDPVFMVEVSIPGFASEIGQGNSKRCAERMAAEKFYDERVYGKQWKKIIMNDVMKTRSGFVVLIGMPNAGKSTLVNQLVGTKVSIVTHKVQTTRTLIRGIVIHDNAQIVLIDTPGVFFSS